MSQVKGKTITRFAWREHDNTGKKVRWWSEVYDDIKKEWVDNPAWNGQFDVIDKLELDRRIVGAKQDFIDVEEYID